MCHFCPYHEPETSGFSLLELSIVLVIVAVLAGGILGGQELLRTAKLRQVLVEQETYKGAIQRFRGQYMAWPGDFAEAETLWGSAGGAGAACYAVSGTGTQTCNGNGDGRVEPWTHSNEGFRAWQHLVNAGMVEGSYTGVEPAGGWADSSVAGRNVPASKYSPGGYSFLFKTNWGNLYPAQYGHLIELMGADAQHVRQGLLLPAEAAMIDGKLDDGLPATGKVLAYPPDTWWKCATTTVPTTAKYDIALDTPQCALMFVLEQ